MPGARFFVREWDSVRLAADFVSSRLDAGHPWREGRTPRAVSRRRVFVRARDAMVLVGMMLPATLY
jgi:hypothetical protein